MLCYDPLRQPTFFFFAVLSDGLADFLHLMILCSSATRLCSHTTSFCFLERKQWQQDVKWLHWHKGRAGKGAQVSRFLILVHAIEMPWLWAARHSLSSKGGEEKIS